MFGGYGLKLIPVSSNRSCLDPCFGGCLVGTMRIARWAGRSVGDLSSRSLFWWMFGGYVAEDVGVYKLENSCLDPCFGGCLVGTYK